MEVPVRTLATAVFCGLLGNQAYAQQRLLLATSLSPIIQNEQADDQGISRVNDETTLNRFVKLQYLVRVPDETPTYYLKGVPARYSYLRPWSKNFLEHIGSQYYRTFHDRLRVTSLVRTGRFQLQLAGYNTNAAPASGPTQSSHLTGATLDISKALMTAEQKNWMRTQLLSLSERGYLYGIEERVQPTFHIMVYKNFPTAVKASRTARGSKASLVKATSRAKAVRIQRASRRHR